MADPASYRPAPGTIPTGPGVYRFSDAEHRVIYVGKAINLRQRLNSYFADPAALHFRTQTMVRTAAQVEWTLVRNELEALQLEYTWIKQFDPRFNIKYRDDKSYPWVAVTWNEEFPRVFVGRGSHKKGVRYFGPYAQAWAIRDTIDSLLRVFPMRSCTNGVFRSAKASGRPCLFGYIGKCSAPCVGRISPDDHRDLVQDVCDFLAGHTTDLTRRLERQMAAASQALEFERAAVVRDQLSALRQVTERNAIVLGDGTDADVIAYAADELEIAFQVFFVRSGRVRGQRGWVADRADDSSIAEILDSFLIQLYADAEPGTQSSSGVPREIYLPERPASPEAVEDLLAEVRGGRVAVKVPQRGDKRAIVETVGRNAAEALVQHKTRRASDLSTRNRALEELQVALDLPAPPLRIECYDISHTQGTQVVGSMVVFEDGLPRKSEYRRFVIRTVEGSNDVASIAEVITRRFRRLLEDRAASSGEGAVLIDATTGAARAFAYAPGLVVVDGGAPQVAAAQAAMSALGISDIPIVGLAKRLEEVWLPGEEFPLILPRNSEGLYLLQRARDEAHRFAITHHRGRRSATMVESLLDDVPGLGEMRRKALLAHFGSLKKLRAARVEDIAQVPGLGERTALAIKAALDAATPGEAVNTATGEIESQ